MLEAFIENLRADAQLAGHVDEFVRDVVGGHGLLERRGVSVREIEADGHGFDAEAVQRQGDVNAFAAGVRAKHADAVHLVDIEFLDGDSLVDAGIGGKGGDHAGYIKKKGTKGTKATR